MIDFKKKREELRQRSLNRVGGKGEYASKKSFSIAIDIPKEIREDSTYKIKPGKNRFDIIPYMVGKNHPFLEEGDLDYILDVYVHTGLGVDEYDSILCLKQYGEICPICNKASELWKIYNKTLKDRDKEKARSLSAKRREIINVRDRNENPLKIRILNVSYNDFSKQMFISFESEPVEYGDLDNLENNDPMGILTMNEPDIGKTIKCFGKQSTVNKDYYQGTAFELEDRKDQYDFSIIEKAFCLTDFLVMPSQEEALRLISLKAEENEDDADVDLGKTTPYGHDDTMTKSNEPECPYGYDFGGDHNKKPKCNSCDEHTFQECSNNIPF